MTPRALRKRLLEEVDETRCIGRETGDVLQKCNHSLVWCLDADSLNANFEEQQDEMQPTRKFNKLRNSGRTVELSGLLCVGKDVIFTTGLGGV